MTAERLHYRVKLSAPDGEYSADEEGRTVVDPSEANVVGSLAADGMHYPVLDLDGIALEVRDSGTPGHTHLLIDHPIPWDDYAQLLRALAKAGLLEPGYVEASIDRGHTAIRLPGCRKPDQPRDPAGFARTDGTSRLEHGHHPPIDEEF